MKKNKYGHVPVVPPPGATEKDRNLIMQLNRLFDDIYIRLGRLQEEADAIRAEMEEDDTDVNEDDEL